MNAFNISDINFDKYYSIDYFVYQYELKKRCTGANKFYLYCGSKLKDKKMD